MHAMVIFDFCIMRLTLSTNGNQNPKPNILNFLHGWQEDIKVISLELANLAEVL